MQERAGGREDAGRSGRGEGAEGERGVGGGVLGCLTRPTVIDDKSSRRHL
jgi:hypothetical protein